MKQQEKIYITGPQGLINSALQRVLQSQNYTNIIVRTHGELDLLNNKAVADFFKSEKPDYVFLTSYKSGSIQENINQPAEFIYENLVVQNNVIHNAYLSKAKKLLYLAASCIYPKNSLQPIKEEYLLRGDLEPTSESYAIAKISGVKMCQAYNKQYATKFISIVPATIYGPDDEFNPDKSHVISAMIRKFHEAKINNQKEVVLWGTGAPRREFLYVDDLSDACIFIMNTESDFDPHTKRGLAPSAQKNNYPRYGVGVDLINVGSGIDITIKELAEKIKEIVDFHGEIKWDDSKPDGAKQKLLDSTRLRSLGWQSRFEFWEGLKMTYQWFTNNYNNLINKHE